MDDGALIRDYVVRVLVKDDVSLGDDEPIFSSGLLDSFSVTLLICFLEERFGVRIPIGDVTIDDFDTISSMLSLLQRIESPPLRP